MSNRFFVSVERWFRIERILFGFWSMFWLLNGLDKFFNGVVPKGGKHPIGWFGVNRDDKFIMYFNRLHLPEELALTTLYSFAVLEIILGMLFLYLVFKRTEGLGERLAFRGSMFVFAVFCTGDILFGDRMELWEHGTFMILALVTYRFYLDRRAERFDVARPRGGAQALDQRDDLSTRAFDDYLDAQLEQTRAEMQAAVARGEITIDDMRSKVAAAAKKMEQTFSDVPKTVVDEGPEELDQTISEFDPPKKK